MQYHSIPHLESKTSFTVSKNECADIDHTIQMFFRSVFLLALFSRDYMPPLISHTLLWEMPLRDFSLYLPRTKLKLQNIYLHAYVFRQGQTLNEYIKIYTAKK